MATINGIENAYTIPGEQPAGYGRLNILVTAMGGWGSRATAIYVRDSYSPLRNDIDGPIVIGVPPLDNDLTPNWQGIRDAVEMFRQRYGDIPAQINEWRGREIA